MIIIGNINNNDLNFDYNILNMTEDNDRIENIEKEERKPLDEGKLVRTATEDKPKKKPKKKKSWLSPKLKFLLIGVGGVAITIAQLMAIIEFITIFLG